MAAKEKLTHYENLELVLDVKDLKSLLIYSYKKISKMSSDELAYEYLRRNPKYISFVKESVDELFKVNDNISLLEAKARQIQEESKYMFLHNASDTMAYFDLKREYKVSDRIELLNSEFKAVYNNEEKYSAQEVKRKNPIFITSLLDQIGENRWLNELRPSINIEFNPYKKHDEIKKNFEEFLRLFNNESILNKMNYISSPNCLLDSGDYDDFINQKIQAQGSPKKPEIKLFLFDMMYILGLNNIENHKYKYTISQSNYMIMQEIFSECFEKDEESGKRIDFVNEYLELDSKNDIHEHIKVSYEDSLVKETKIESQSTHTYRLNEKAIREIKQTKKYIFGDYLKLIYPYKSVDMFLSSVEKNQQYSDVTKTDFNTYTELLKKEFLLKDFETKKRNIEHIYSTPYDYVAEKFSARK